MNGRSDGGGSVVADTRRAVAMAGGQGAAVLRWTEAEALAPDARHGLIGPGGPFELVDEDVLGHRVTVFRNRQRSLAELVAGASAHGDRPFLCGPDGTLRFGDLPAAVDAAAARLGVAGVGPGDRVLLAGRTSEALVLAVLGTISSGAVAVLANPAWTAAELEDAVAVTRPALVVADDDVRAHLGRWGVPALSPDALAGPAPSTPHAPAPIDEDDPCAILFTSGTTGRAKGAVLSHRNAVHFCLSTALTSLVRGMVTGVAPGGGSPPTVIASAPLFHVSGLLGQLVNGLAWGITLVVAPPGRWDATTHLALTEEHRVTTWSLVPTQLWRIVEHPDLDRFDLSSLATIGGGGAVFPPELLRQVADRLPRARAGVRIGYGMTETAGTVTLLQPPIVDDELTSVGRAVAGAEIQIRSLDGQPLPAGPVGQIWARSASVFLGYWDDPAADADAFDDDRWYATGDFGRIDGDLLRLESRLRDMIIRGGENVYPIEIENRLVEHPAVAAAAVIGVPHRELGQTVKAVVVPAEGAEPTEDEIRAWVAERLARHKVPDTVELRAELPTNHLGKVLKHLLDPHRANPPAGHHRAPGERPT